MALVGEGLKRLLHHFAIVLFRNREIAPHKKGGDRGRFSYELFIAAATILSISVGEGFHMHYLLHLLPFCVFKQSFLKLFKAEFLPTFSNFV